MGHKNKTEKRYTHIEKKNSPPVLLGRWKRNEEGTPRLPVGASSPAAAHTALR